jgi:hypothetical protein
METTESTNPPINNNNNNDSITPPQILPSESNGESAHSSTLTSTELSKELSRLDKMKLIDLLLSLFKQDPSLGPKIQKEIKEMKEK